MNTIEKMIPFAAAAMATSIHAGPNTSKLWEDYSSARLTGSVPELADFSYVGYHSGERSIPDPGWKVFDVTDFGAVPDDGKSDKEAVVKAIAAAEENGSGIVYFPAGRFRINDISDPHNEPIRITSSHIILRGSGSGANGTELFMERHMDPSDPKKLWTCLYVIDISGRGGVDVSSKVTSNSRRETFSVRVARPSSFREGDWVELIYKDNSPEAVAAATAPYEPDAAWKSIINDGVEVYEIHRIHTISGNRLTFKEPIHSDINADWKVRKLSMLEEIGVEDIAFVGNWHEEFVHHKNPIHDGGWSCLKMSNCVNSWVRDCRFTDMNRPVSVAGSAAITIQDVLLNGTLGHSAISLNGTCHSLVQRIKDTAGHWHANGVAGTCSGNVFLRSEYSEDTCFEAHSSQPRWTLFDNIRGGWKYGRWGGALKNQPNHLEGLVFWNYENTGEGEAGAFHFIRPDSVYGRIVMPYVVGFHGNPQGWAKAEIKVLESNGKPVYPESLYEAQFQLRKSLEGRERN